MAIVPWNPAFGSMLRWPDIWDEDGMGSISTLGGNNLDLYETDNEVVLRASVAGVEEKDIDITFEKGVVWIKAQKEEIESDEKRKHYSKSSWNYSYKVAIPGLIDPNQEPDAVVKNGVLSITFKKAEASKPKKLSVKSGT